MKVALKIGLFVVLALAVAGCGGGSGPAAGTRGFGPFELALSSPKTIYALGEQVPFSFTVKNVTSKTVTAVGGGCDVLLRIITQDGQDVTHAPACAAAGFTVQLGPGETKEFLPLWDQKLDAGGFAPSGKDTIRAWINLKVIDGQDIPDAEIERDLSSNPLIITVTP